MRVAFVEDLSTIYIMIPRNNKTIELKQLADRGYIFSIILHQRTYLGARFRMETVDVELGNEEISDGNRGNRENDKLIRRSIGNLRHISSQANYQSTASIYMVPNTLRKLNPSAYSPRVISIGPLHKDRKHLRPMNGCKHIFMQQLFSRTLESRRNYVDPMEECLHAVHAEIGRIKDCYSLKHTAIRWGETLNDSRLAEMMVIDGCFIIELLNRLDEKIDPLIDNVLLTSDVTHDLFLLENQIPLFVLEDIFECTVRKFKRQASLPELVLSLFIDINPFDRQLKVYNDEADASPPHILGLLQKTCLPEDSRRSEFPTTKSYSASELARAGVIFQPNKDSKWQLDMEFKPSPWLSLFCWAWGKPTLKMPVFHIQDSTESYLRNLIAYELCSPKVSNYITSFVFAMDTLIDTKDDVDKLEESDVLSNDLGFNDAAANMINNLCKEVVLTEFYFSEQWKQLYKYYNGYWPKNIAWLRRTYFSNPWNSIALVAAIILFSLTVVQTCFTIWPTN